MIEHDWGREFVREGLPTDPIELSRLHSKLPLQLKRPCDCGCDSRAGNKGVGYIQGGIGVHFVSLWIQHEETYQVLEALFWAHGLTVAP